MDTLILNAGHSQLEEQLKIAAKCGMAEQQGVDEEMEDDDELVAGDSTENEKTSWVKGFILWIN